jgi:hypothetical protein
LVAVDQHVSTVSMTTVQVATARAPSKVWYIY